MPIFYIDVYDNEMLARDEFGLELDNLDEAREQAIALLPDMARQGLPDGDAHDYTAVVRCPEGRIRYEARLSLRGAWVEDAATLPPRTHH